MNETPKKLSESQLSHFNCDLMEPNAKIVFWQQFQKYYSEKDALSILDIGGGGGYFADLLLECLPNVRITILDNSEYLLSRNRPSERKTLVCGSAERIEELFVGQKFDLITIHWVLHHLVGPSRQSTIKIIKTVLSQAQSLLKKDGHISVFENVMSGSVIDSYPNRFIYAVTSLRIPLVTSLIRKYVFNTAGIGVFFMSDKMLNTYFRYAGLQVQSRQLSNEWYKSKLFRIVLMMHSIRVIDYWLKRKNA